MPRKSGEDNACVVVVAPSEIPPAAMVFWLCLLWGVGGGRGKKGARLARTSQEILVLAATPRHGHRERVRGAAVCVCVWRKGCLGFCKRQVSFCLASSTVGCFPLGQKQPTTRACELLGPPDVSAYEFENTAMHCVKREDVVGKGLSRNRWHVRLWRHVHPFGFGPPPLGVRLLCLHGSP